MTLVIVRPKLNTISNKIYYFFGLTKYLLVFVAKSSISFVITNLRFGIVKEHYAKIVVQFCPVPAADNR